jgi:hypothetical protein
MKKIMFIKHCNPLEYTVFDAVLSDTEYQDIVKDYLSKRKPFELEDDSLIFFDKSCNVPRAKVRNYLETVKQGKITIHEEKASIIVSSLVVSDVLGRKDISGYHVKNKNKFLELIEKVWETSTTFVNCFNNADEVFAGYHVLNRLERAIKEKNLGVISITGVTNAKYESIITFENQETLSREYFVAEEDIIREINGTNAVIDKEHFLLIMKMLSSTNPDDVGMGIQTMCYSNYELSKRYLIMLLGACSREILNHKFSNSVDFKSLLSYFGLHDRMNIYSFDVMERLLKEHNQWDLHSVLLIATGTQHLSSKNQVAQRGISLKSSALVNLLDPSLPL